VLAALILVTGLGYGGYAGVKTKITALVAGTRTTWYAPYVDVTLLPTYQFQSTSANPARQAVLGFVVAGPNASCTPSWGAAYTLAGAGQSLALGSRIAQLRQNGASRSCRSAARATPASTWRVPAWPAWRWLTGR